MAILIYPDGTTVVRTPANGRFFTRFEKDGMVPGHDMTMFLTDEVSMLARTDAKGCVIEKNEAATERVASLSGAKPKGYVYGPALLFNNTEFDGTKKEKRKMKTIAIYTDGSVINNPGGNGGTGWVIIVDGEVVRYGGTGYESTTNNRMEMRAVIEALEEFERLGIRREKGDRLTVYSDSQNVILPLRGIWRVHKNLDLWKRLFELRDKHKATWWWVKGHAGNQYNEMCDTLANEARTGETLVEDVGYAMQQTLL